ncbi:Hpt domain-containing protein [Arthrobacter sp. MP_2.3]|uniref:Hpt domain-containing protein n=1 Tax=Arthrobacter sp. MP_2.3 TaxID=3349633 RepID=UPI0038D4C847
MVIPGSSEGDCSTNGVCFSASPDSGPGERVAPGAGLPLLDLQVLRQLEVEMGDPAVARSFAQDYVRIWEKRIQLLIGSVANRDPYAAMDAVLSLKNSALMVGASRLSALALELEDIIPTKGFSSAPARVAVIAEVGKATNQALQRCYLALTD